MQILTILVLPMLSLLHCIADNLRKTYHFNSQKGLTNYN